MEKSLHLTLTLFMNELNDIFSLKLPKHATEIDKSYFCLMGLIKNYKFTIHKDDDMIFSMLTWFV